jgi:hypothetical protein
MIRMVVRRAVRRLRTLPVFIARHWLRRSAKPSSGEPSPRPAYEERHQAWFHRLHFPPITSFGEFWRDPRDDPDFSALAEKYGEEKAVVEVAMLQSHLPREVVTAAVGLLYILAKIEAILVELLSKTPKIGLVERDGRLYELRRLPSAVAE